MLTPASTFVDAGVNICLHVSGGQILKIYSFLNFFIARNLAYVLQYAREEKGLLVRAPQKSPRPPRRPHEVKSRPQAQHFTRIRPVRSFRGFLLKLSGTKGGTYASKKCYSDAEGEPPHPRRFSPGQGTGERAPAIECSIAGRGRLLQHLKGQADGLGGRD